MRFGNKGRIECQTPPKVQHQTDDTQQEDVVSNISFGLTLEKIAGYKNEIIHVEHNHEREWYGKVACISNPINVPVPTFDEEERETEHNPPADNVYQYLQGTTCGYKGLFHKDKDSFLFVSDGLYRV